MNYWLITLWDGEKIRVKPRNVAFIKDKMAQGEGHIITKTRTIAVKDIKTFEESDIKIIEGNKTLGAGSALQEAAAAFSEQMDSDSGVVARAVKKTVSRKKWDTFMSHNPAYKLLNDNDSYVVVGFVLPVHLIDPTKVDWCDDREARIVLKSKV